MKIENPFRKNRTVIVAGTEVVFDEHGVASADDAVVSVLLGLGGYRACGPDANVKPDAAPAAPQPDLESMNAAQLKKLAKERGIDVGEASKKADLIALIEEAAKV